MLGSVVPIKDAKDVLFLRLSVLNFAGSMHGFLLRLLFSLKNACAKKPCQNNSTCQAGFTDRDYQCLCIVGFTGHDCEVGKKYH